MSKEPLLPERLTPFYPRGMINVGNMCFVNAVLQPLLYSQRFYDLFDKIGRAEPDEHATPLLHSL